MHLDERSGLRGDVDPVLRTTLGGRGRHVQFTMVHLEGMTASSTPRGYGGQVALTGMEDMAGKVSTVSLNQDEIT
jgi:hypothetical protein